MFFKKDIIVYEQNDNFFTLNDKVIHFADIDAINSKRVVNYTNSVYIKTDIYITLMVQGKEMKLEANTKDLEHYKMLSDLVNAIEKYKGKVFTIKDIESFQKKVQREAKYWKYFWIFFTPFALNGIGDLWFHHTLFKHVAMINIPSNIAGMLLSIWIVVSPVFFVIAKLNAKKLQRESDFLAGRESSAKDIDFSNVLLFVLIVTLVVMFMSMI